ncbi:MAG TPA: hypothetical protein PKH69_06620 [Thiobacillaceae bacterium]|nr:hypothetical protein [Thiobacillaceae bacterium]HNU63835.1 hypothetical protein [Thiobacillaceae bacterium]
MNSSQHVEVAVVASADGTDRISLRMGGGSEPTLLTLTSSQARLLATELIASVNRVEVKVNLKAGSNLWRRPGEARPRLAAAG